MAEPASEGTTRLSATGRVEAFSDGVMAIAITLLVLDLKVPTQAEVSDAGSLAAALGEHWPAYLAYLAAFLAIGIIWLNHRAFIDKVARFDDRLLWLNLLLLLGVATLPFPTALLAEYVGAGGPAASTAAALYGSLAVLTALPWSFMWRHLADRPDLLEPPYDSVYARAELRRAGFGPLVYIAAIAIALVAPIVALLVYIAIAVLYAITSQRG